MTVHHSVLWYVLLCYLPLVSMWFSQRWCSSNGFENDLGWQVGKLASDVTSRKGGAVLKVMPVCPFLRYFLSLSLRGRMDGYLLDLQGFHHNIGPLSNIFPVGCGM